jgi:hypothetical protein
MRLGMHPPGKSDDVPEEAENRSVDAEPVELRSPDLEGRDRSMDPDRMTLDDIAEAEAARPDLPGETDDGLDELEESVRREAEDLPIDAPGRDR